MLLVLASSSPRRRRIMEDAGHVFVVRSSHVEELRFDQPEEMVVENAIRKARAAQLEKGELVVGADTIVVCKGEPLGKPVNREDAARMLRVQIGYPTRVISGLSVIDTSNDSEIHGLEISSVKMSGNEKAVREYIDSGLWEGKAGAFGIQDDPSITIELLWGELDNVIGMPMTLLGRILTLAGYGPGSNEVEEHVPDMEGNEG
ncbi:MAG: Maf family protein [Thermoplasmatota archaeon]